MRCVLITGGTDGIGLALVRHYKNAGDRVIVSGRRPPDQLPEDFPSDTFYVQADQTDIGTVQAVCDAVGDSLDLAILNAGVGFSSDTGAEDERQAGMTLTANLDFNILLTHALFTPLQKRGGKLVLIGSVAHRGAAKFPSYAASKAGLHGFARALREEWHGRVKVQIIHPGPTKTAMHAKAGFDTSKMDWMFLAPTWMAGAIAAAVEQGRPRVTLSHGAWVMSGLRWLDGPLKLRKPTI